MITKLEEDIEAKLNEMNRTVAWALHERVKVLGELKRYEEAIADCTVAINTMPTTANEEDMLIASLLWTDMGTMRYNAGRVKESIPDYDNAIVLDPQNVYAWASRGCIKLEVGRVNDALEDLTTAIRIDGRRKVINPIEKVLLWVKMGDAYLLISQYAEAISAYDNAIELDPKNETAWNSRGFAKEELGRYDDAMRDLDKAIELDSKNETIWNNRGVAKSELGRYEEALSDFGKAIKLNPELPNSYSWRGRIYEIQGCIVEANNDYRTALMQLHRIPPEKLSRNNIKHLGISTRGLRRLTESKEERVKLKEDLREKIHAYKSRIN